MNPICEMECGGVDTSVKIESDEITLRISNVSIVPHWVEQEKFMSLNTKFKHLSIKLIFWFKLVLSFLFRAHHAQQLCNGKFYFHTAIYFLHHNYFYTKLLF